MKDKIKFNQPVDIVYMWVDGNDLEWQKEKSKWQEKLNLPFSKALSSCRFTDNQELRYSLRSVQMYAPWIRKIFIITNGQIPKWLDVNHPKIQLVRHDQIMPKDALPTFNSTAIESCIPNIPDLSEHFLLANDDTFFDKPTSPDYFFNTDGNPIVRLIKHSWTKEILSTSIYCHMVYKAAQKCNPDYLNYESTHTISAYRKSYFNACKAEFADWFFQTTQSRFRRFEDVQRTIVDFWCLKHKKADALCTSYSSHKRNDLCLEISSAALMNDMLDHHHPFLVCYNDTEYVKLENRRALKHFLAQRYKQTQAWETDTNLTIHPLFSDKKGIVFAPDNNYSKYFAVALKSLIENTPKDENCDVVVLGNNFEEKNILRIKRMLPNNFSLRFFDIESYINDNFSVKFTARSYWSITTYYRIFIPLIMPEYERVIYFDSDMCFDQPITELFNTPFDGKSLIAVIDTASPTLDTHLDRKKQMTEILGLKHPENYFNAGMTVFNPSKIDGSKYIQKCLDIFKTKPLLFQDQDLLNIVFEDDVKLIDCKFNSQWHTFSFTSHELNIGEDGYRNNYLDGCYHPVVIHYTSPNKPWFHPEALNADIFWKYARMTPFYETILSDMIRHKTLKIVNHTLHRTSYKIKYYKYKILKHLTFGKKSKKYKEKQRKYKTLLKEIKQYFKSVK